MKMGVAQEGSPIKMSRYGMNCGGTLWLRELQKKKQSKKRKRILQNISSSLRAIMWELLSRSLKQSSASRDGNCKTIHPVQNRRIFYENKGEVT